jgi:hypothetical protein
MKTRIRENRGSGLVEALVAITLVSVILGAMVGTAVHQQRFYMVAGDAADAVATLERLETVVGVELLPLNGSAGDIVFAGKDSIAVRAYRGAYFLCAKYPTAPVHIKVRALTEDLAPVPDSGIVYASGTKGTLADDHWKPVTVSSVKSDFCPDSTPGWDLVVHGLGGVLNEIPIGAPMRLFHHGSYWLTAQRGGWYLMTDALQRSPTLVGGPLAPADSSAGSVLTFRYLNNAGMTTAQLDSIAKIEIDAVTLGVVPKRRTGEPLRKDRTVSIRLRNADY